MLLEGIPLEGIPLEGTAVEGATGGRPQNHRSVR
jgi:hypothetical protein